MNLFDINNAVYNQPAYAEYCPLGSPRFQLFHYYVNTYVALAYFKRRIYLKDYTSGRITYLGEKYSYDKTQSLKDTNQPRSICGFISSKLFNGAETSNFFTAAGKLLLDTLGKKYALGDIVNVTSVGS